MNDFNVPVLFFLRWAVVGLFLYRLVHSVGLHSPLGANWDAEFLASTVLASAAVWVQDWRSRRWTWSAFLVLSIGVVRLLMTGHRLSGYGVAIWIAAALAMRFLRPRRVARAAAPVVTPRAAAVQASSAESDAADYSFDQNVRRPRHRFADLIGMTETKKRLLAAAEEIIADTSSRRNGILLFGEPGNGKTLFAEALAGEFGVPFFPVTYGDIASKWVNETPRKVEAVFQQARRMKKCVLFLDEFDSFAKPREGSHAMNRDLANVLLTGINDLHGTQVVMIAATNFIDSVDPAAVRDGRFDFRVEVPPPDFEARRAILRKAIGESLGYAMVDTQLVTSLARRWEGFSASRLAGLGGPLSELRRDGAIGSARVTFAQGMQAMRMLQGRRGRLPEQVKSIDEIVMPPVSRRALIELAYRMRELHRLERIGGQLPSGLVFAGPPGTGKTQAAMSLAKASGFAFLKTTGATIMADPASWDMLVREAKDIRPTIVFIDEAEDLLADRRYSRAPSLTNKILTTLDGADGRIPDVIYIAATNHYDQLDPAATRGGRFEEKMYFDVPDAADMERYVRRCLKAIADRRYTLKKGVIEKSLRVLDGRSIADADALFNRALSTAAVRALQENVTELRPGDIALAARVVLPPDVDGDVA